MWAEILLIWEGKFDTSLSKNAFMNLKSKGNCFRKQYLCKKIRCAALQYISWCILVIECEKWSYKRSISLHPVFFFYNWIVDLIVDFFYNWIVDSEIRKKKLCPTPQFSTHRGLRTGSNWSWCGYLKSENECFHCKTQRKSPWHVSHLITSLCLHKSIVSGVI